MRKLPSAIAYLIATALIVAGLIYGFRGGSDDKAGAGTTATANPVRYMSTDGVKENIERRLTQSQGQPILATCPKRVPRTIGTTFQCKVFFQGRADSIAAAHVKIDGPRGQFHWKSASKVKSKPS